MHKRSERPLFHHIKNRKFASAKRYTQRLHPVPYNVQQFFEGISRTLTNETRPACHIFIFFGTRNGNLISECNHFGNQNYQNPLKINMSFPNAISVKSTNGLATNIAMTHKSHSDSEPWKHSYRNIKHKLLYESDRDSSISVRNSSIGTSPISRKKKRCSRHLSPMERSAGRRRSNLANRPGSSGCVVRVYSSNAAYTFSRRSSTSCPDFRPRTSVMPHKKHHHKCTNSEESQFLVSDQTTWLWFPFFTTSWHLTSCIIYANEENKHCETLT